MTQRRVLFVNVTFPPQSQGGASRVVQRNIDCMIDDDRYDPCGVFCSLVGNNQPERHETWLHRGVPVFAVACPWRDDMERLVSRDDVVDPFTRFLERVQPDLVHFHCIQRMGLELVEAVAARGIPSVLTIHDGWWVADDLFMIDSNLDLAIYDYTTQEPTIARSRMGALRTAISKFDRVLTVSETFRNILLSTGLCEDISVNENGVFPVPSQSKTPSDKARLLYLGGVDARKGYHFLRAAVRKAELSNVSIRVVDHARREGFSRSGLWGSTDVQTIGYVREGETQTLYADADIVVVPSLWPESFSLVSREAIQAGCWLLASDLGATGDPIVPGINGYTFATESIDDLVGLLRILDRDPARYKKSPSPTPLRSVAEQYHDLRDVYDEVLHVK
ncbi:glycosyl transferase [Tateyamaria omphalii]|uniref:glycosyltransferase n=1 Tax=Tateyamaria omphalii TaxID=299262 RepID=UPI0019A2FD9A|nr:glycosyltransferase [Tateyamaria omphalii]GGX46651.1 glycosyl transferase [Tateyamaria omphalii]